MNTNRNFTALALFATLAACQGGNAPAGTNAASTASNAQKPADEQSGLVGMVGAAMDKARAEMATKNISIGNGVHVNINGHEVDSPDSRAPHAEITPQGDLLIAGKAVDITPAQRASLLEYRGEIIDVASAGMDIGKQGVDIAGKAVSTAIAGIFNGKTDQAEQEMEAQGDRIEAAAMKLCDQLPAMLRTQQQLAAELPAFQPYANMTQSDIDDCRKHDDNDSHGGERARIQQDIRNGIRESIRSAVREPSSPDTDTGSHGDAAAEADAAATKGG